MCSTTLVATWIALAKGFATESTCDDEVVLLQHSHKKVVKTKKGGSSMGPDDNGLCNWGSVFGADVPDDVTGVQDVFVTSCTQLYSASVCAPVAEEIFNVFDNTVPFDDQTDDHPFFCEEITELIVASTQHQRELQPDMALLGKPANSALLSRMLLSTKPSGENLEKVLQRKNMGNLGWFGDPESWQSIQAAAQEAAAALEPAAPEPVEESPAPAPRTGCKEHNGVPADRPPSRCTPCVKERFGTAGCDMDPCRYSSPEDNRCGPRRRRTVPAYASEAWYDYERGQNDEKWGHDRRRSR